MIKLIVTIEELENIDFKKGNAIGTEISIQEIGKKATKGEKAVSDILKKRLKVDEKIQIEGLKEEFIEELKEYLNSL